MPGVRAKAVIAGGSVRVGEAVELVELGLRVAKQVPAYIAAKAGLIRLTEALALEFAPHGIRVNAIGPGPAPRQDTGAASVPAEQFPIGRALAYDDMVGTALYLASDAAAMVTGQFIIVDGGLGLRPAY